MLKLKRHLAIDVIEGRISCLDFLKERSEANVSFLASAEIVYSDSNFVIIEGKRKSQLRHERS